jgi:hypothetical protein
MKVSRCEIKAHRTRAGTGEEWLGRGDLKLRLKEYI